MKLESIEVGNFRNYENAKLEFHPKTNILYGDNAQGKTNILESIYVCATTNSHKGSKDKELIRFGEDEAHIRMFLTKREMTHKIDMHLRKSKGKGIAIDGVPIKRSSELMGLAHVIFFSPEDLKIIKNGPSERRRFVNMELCQLDPLYLYDLAEGNFEKALAESKERDMKFCSTNVGPHRDDLCFMNGELDLRKFGSQGQQRTCALALKLAEIEIVKKSSQDCPILLLDDVLSELDRNRQNYLLDSIHDIQTIITCTGLEEFIDSRLTLDRVFRVKEGTVTLETR